MGFTIYLISIILQIPDYRNAVIVARNPNSVKRATSYAERLRLSIAVIHGEDRVPEDKEDDGRTSPPIDDSDAEEERPVQIEAGSLKILPCKWNIFVVL